jgi:protein-tyrosine kinase
MTDTPYSSVESPPTVYSGDGIQTIADILVDAGRLTQTDADKISDFAANEGMKFGDAAIALQRLTVRDVEFALARQFRYPVAEAGAACSIDSSVVAFHRPHTANAEELRTIRSRLLVRWLRPSGRNILAIASPQRGDGRTWMAANLATVFAQAGERTLLIDTDLRNPRLHQVFGLINNAGLTDVLAGRTGRELLQPVHAHLRLQVLPAGSASINPQELLSRGLLDAVLETFADKFDLIILDTPAAMESADVEAIAPRADGVIVVARKNSTSSTHLATVVDRIERSSAKVIGSVLNDY